MYDLLSNHVYGLYAIDCRIVQDRLLAGWVYADAGLPEYVVLSSEDDQFSVQVHIPESVRALKQSVVNYFENQPVEFLIAVLNQFEL